MTPILIRLQNDAQFCAPVPAGKPVGGTMPMTRTALDQDVPSQNVSTGIWECTAGCLRRQIMQAEYSYIVEGKGVFIPDNGDPIAFQAGDSIYFAPNTHGIWEITETVRKTYLILRD